MRTKIFISSSKKDRKFLEQLQVHLRPLERQGRLECWDDTRMQPGQPWREQIQRALANTRVAVLLLSPDYLDTNFIVDEELPSLLSAAQKEGVSILPVPVRPCLAHEEKSLADLHMVSWPDCPPLAGVSSHKRDEFFVQLVRDIRTCLADPAIPLPIAASLAAESDVGSTQSKAAAAPAVTDSQGYLFDLFVSYRRHGAVLAWVRTHLYSLLQRWLPHSLPHEPRICIDWSDHGDVYQEWPAELREKLRRSRCLLAVWSPDYFRSPWCQAELASMLVRERQLARTAQTGGVRLVYPVVFSDGEYVPESLNGIPIRGLAKRDFRRWNSPEPMFAKTREMVRFDKEVQVVAAELATMIQQAPVWEESWPIVTPEACAEIKVPMVRLG